MFDAIFSINFVEKMYIAQYTSLTHTLRKKRVSDWIFNPTPIEKFEGNRRNSSSWQSDPLPPNPTTALMQLLQLLRQRSEGGTSGWNRQMVIDKVDMPKYSISFAYCCRNFKSSFIFDCGLESVRAVSGLGVISIVFAQ